MFSALNTFGVSSYFTLNLQKPFHNSRYFVHCSATQGSTVPLTPGVNGLLSNVKDVITRNAEKVFEDEKLEPLWDDGYGTETVKDYLEFAKDLIKPDGGPPRWFTPISCGPHLKDSPVLLYLPGVGGLGLGLILHHKALGKVFDVRCMHIPVQDRTPFEELIEWIEETVRAEHSSSPSKPIYLVGDSFGCCLALAVAARNPKVDLVLILANPATSIGRSQLQPLLSVLEALPVDLYVTVPYLLRLMGEPLKFVTVNINALLSPTQYLDQLAAYLNGLLPRLSVMPEILPKESLLWKLKLLKTAAGYANSRLHAVTAEVLILASGNDNLLPSQDEALRLMSLIRTCKMRYFKDNGHSILSEDGFNLLTIIKSTRTYRRSRTRDYVIDYLPPSASEFNQIQNGTLYSWFRNLAGPVMFSTKEDGSVVRGLSGVPDEGPVLLVGYHTLVGFEIAPLLERFLQEKKIMVRGIAHPIFFSDGVELPNNEAFLGDLFSLYGTLPVSAGNLSKLYDRKCHVLLYPGGIREAFHRKGEDYKLFWPEQPEFVRMAAKYGATIVPFGAVGEDDLAELVLDYDDLMRIPFISDQLKQYNEKYSYLSIRAGTSGEVANQPLHIPGIVPKAPPGRLYYLFGKPISMKGRDDVLKDKEKARELYITIKGEVESCLRYLSEKREEDPYRNFIDRTVYRAFRAPMDNVPSFEP